MIRTGLAALLCTTALAACAQSAPEGPPNYVEITPKLATAGQPGAAWLGGLKAKGFDVVIFIAPPTVSNALKDEHLIVGRQGLVYVNIPVDWQAPKAADFDAFTRTLAAYADRKVLVHCQANLRASSFVFLHRVIALKEAPESAWESVRRVWEPEPAWRAFILATLKRHGIAWEPL